MRAKVKPWPRMASSVGSGKRRLSTRARLLESGPTSDKRDKRESSIGGYIV